MPDKQDIIDFLAENKDFFKKKFGIIKIGIFGSYARGEQTENSDIDILILMNENTEDIFDKRLEFRDLISEEFSKNVDVCHEQAIKPMFKPLIFKDLIYV
ncbi:MAG: nucleotidyltransferase domain-containing protein [Bacteroidales bacterium]|nr:nucleotidyltransferase domain-containing protein [Bacteroidales bacterium]